MEGIVPILKPPGVTSHDVVGIVRRILREKRVGHSGTLDPMATGVLPIYVGKTTRLIEYAGEGTKTYVAEARLGVATDTEDATGTVLTECMNGPVPTWEALQLACDAFLGDTMQRPSSFSAIKVNGKRAYELARKGELVELPARPIHISECTVLAYAFPYMTIRVTCSGGTYIRALLRDICASLGQIGTMTALTRTAVDAFSIEESITIEELEKHGAEVLLPATYAVANQPRMDVSAEEALALQQGKRLSLKGRNLEQGIYALFAEGHFLGMSEVTDVALKAKKMLYTLTDEN